MLFRNLKIIGFIVCNLAIISSLHAKNNYAVYYKNLPFEMQKINAPQFKNNTVNITETGGVG